MNAPPSVRTKPSIETALERGLFAGRWIMAPFYIGLMAALALLMVVFVREFIIEAPAAITSTEHAILLILSLIDLSLAGNLILIVTFSGYENFVSKIDTRGHIDRPEWMGTIDFSAMKIKLIGSIVAISAISLLRAFMQLAVTTSGAHGDAPDYTTLGWMLGLHFTFVISGVLFALMDWLSEKSHQVGERTAREHASLAEHGPSR
jgi:uncharacterized protein (TIGR00645 family)